MENRPSTLPTTSKHKNKWKTTLMERVNIDSGLRTPPNSQDATKMLISPPPEEVLRRVSLSFHCVCVEVVLICMCRVACLLVLDLLIPNAND
jgi:hypothetical protein